MTPGLAATLRARLASAAPVYGALACIAAWSLACALKLVDPVLLPPPGDAFGALWQGFIGGSLRADFFQTAWRTLLAFAIAVAVAVPLGLVFGSSQRLYSSIEFVVDFFRSTPSSVMFPLFLVLFGVGEETKIAVAAFGASLVILFNVAYGVMNTRKTRQAAVKAMGASRLRVMIEVTLLESLPQTFIGMRNGVSLALVIIIVAEMFIGSTDGLGQRVIKSQTLFDMPDMYASIFAAGVLGYGMNLLFLVAERMFVHWGGK